ncbi:WXG100 family type VII secretion target [Streptomyces sp. enrichment culture]|uniref:WXG100 family type VII secretion target n=1 Tax=Streptomyces sp. enrichment culture TaxID=1795815 RepID=UPI003F561E9D
MGTEEQNLTPEQQQSQDASKIQTTFSATDRLERFSAQFGRMGFGTGSGPGGFFGKTNFENAPLNAMLDLLEAANPAELEAAGTALEAARKALNDAARDLKKDAAAVELKGVAGTEFQRFAADLAAYTYNLASFANIVGAQMKVASTGLASVRNARPPRDNRPDPKKPTDFPPAERTADNEDYQKAVKAERDRQEAINQLNRLASFYAVSESTLAAQEPPKFPERLKAAVPPPSAGSDQNAAPRGAGPAAMGPAGASAPQGAYARPGEAGGSAGGTGGHATLGPTPPPAMPDPSMQIDTIAPPAPPVTAPPAPAPTPTVPSTSTNPFTPPPMAPGLPTTGKGPVTGRNPVAPAGPRTAGPTTSQYGRPGVPGGPQVGPGTPGQAAGRTVAPGQASPVGRPGTPGTPGTPAAGRQNVIGAPGTNNMVGRPGSPGAPVTGRAGAPASPVAGRATTGIVGGTPQQRPATGGGAGSRIPTGTVIGGQAAAQGRPSAARPATGGVIGANPGAAARSTGRGTPSVNGVVGTPRSQRARGQKDEEQPGSERPDYLVEDEETWATRRRGAVPPVID